MRRSVNEVTSEMKKACRGAGFSVGEAEGLAKAAATLVTIGSDGVGALLQGVNSQKDPTANRACSIAGLLEEDVFNAARNGFVLFELMLSKSAGNLVTLKKVDVPLLFIGIAIEVARTHQCLIEIAWSDFKLLITPRTKALTIPESLIKADVLVVDLQTNTPSETYSDENESPDHFDGLVVNETLWPEITKLAYKTYVPASETSRMNGAGADINDND